MTTTSLPDVGNECTTAREKIARDVRGVLDDAEELLTLTAAQTGERVADVRGRLRDSLQTARERVEDLRAEAAEAAHSISSAAERCVRENPWKSLGAVAAAGAVAGVVIGMLIGRRQ